MSDRPPLTRGARIAARYRSLIEPTIYGLPNIRVLAWFPLLVGVGALVLVVLQVSGTSSGAYWTLFGTGEDPDLLIGGPRIIRSDEWIVHQGWVISQWRQGFPVVNETFPGGMATTLGFDLPAWDWSMILRPQLWGYLLFGPDAGIAWEWWTPAFLLVASTYSLVVTLLPRRPMMAAFVACAVFFTPIFQWWYGSTSMFAGAWPILAITATLWMLRAPQLWVRILWAVAAGWFGACLAATLYVPFILPGAVVFLFFFVGAVLQERARTKAAVISLVRRLSPLLLAGVGALGLVLAWIADNRAAAVAMTSTVYPGQRSESTGALLLQDPHAIGFAGAVWGQTFATTDGPSVLGPNASEAATALLIGVFLLPGLVWFVIRSARRGRVDFVLLMVGAVVLLVLAYLFVPGWDPLARLLMFDRVTASRFRMAFAVLIPVVFALVAREAERPEEPAWGPRTTRWVALGSVLMTAGIHVLLLLGIIAADDGVLAVAVLWPVALVALLVAIGLVFFRTALTAAAAALLVAATVTGAAVNPLYLGAFDLGGTDVGSAVLATDAEEPGTWVGIGSDVVMGVLMETGVRAYAGVQPYPPTRMWQDIDPGGDQEQAWNRLAHVRWTWGEGEPQLSNPYPDVVLGTFDPCSDFAQQHVDYVLAEETISGGDCLDPIDDIVQGASRMQLFRVVAPAEAVAG
ncbi:DUF7657 domain-containing protein [Protaetiibacter mangrovi]|uniref:Glycosyltransferase RgtA/B/C/D-like domain-containing protein n=1 Tax=Protaetiibacter mangrovi TaxID=2970926 RepID=A0ABT1ZFG8_9MICO|nr:hypothetical protein [Protaetiibacter mangrovi]MCS0499470.1 hypothetical protein [Protaetiibacter mangrovi]